MHKSLFRWRLGATVLIICLMLAFNTVVILAQDATDEPPAASTEPTETETPLPIPTDTPTVSPTVEAPTLAPTDIPVEATETPIATEETVTPEATDVATEEVTTEAPPTDATAETPTVVVPVAEEPALSLLVRELFDNGDLSPWLSGTRWSLAASENGQALQVVNSNDPIVLQKGAFYNVAVQTRFLWTTGSAQISLRKTAVGNYTAAINANGSITLERGDDVVASSVVAPVPAGTWRTLRLSAINDVIRVAIDDVAVITYSDIAPLPPGDVSLSADFSPAPGDANPTPVTQTLLADDFFLWVPLAELGLYPAPTPIAAPTEPPATAVIPTAEPTEAVVEITPEPTEVVVEPTVEITAEPTEAPPTETEIAPVEMAGPHDDLTEAFGKDVSEVAPPSAEEIASAQGVNNNAFASSEPVGLNPLGYYVINDDNIGSSLEGSEPVPVCGHGLDRTDWFSLNVPTTGPYTFSTAGSSFDTIMSIYNDVNGTIGGLTPFGCNDDASVSVITSQLYVASLPAGNYRIQVGGYNGRFGTYSFRVQQGSTPAALGAVALNLPANLLTSNHASPNFTWTKLANANSYEIQVATNATFTTGFQTHIVNSGSCPLLGATCSYNGFVLPSPATYYWRVRGRTLNDVNGAFSVARIDHYRTAPPTLSAPLDNAVVTASKPTLSWVAYPGASYKIQIDEDPGFGTPTNFSPVGVGVSFIPPTSLIQGDWYWRVAATSVLGSGDTAYSAGRKFTVNIEAMPLNNAVITLVGAAVNAPVTFSWAAVPGATGYTVFLSNNSDMTGATAFPAALPASLSVVVPTRPAAIYYWYVAPTGFLPPTAPVPPSIIRKFSISPPAPTAPVLVTPATGNTLATTNPTLTWNPTVTTAGTPFVYEVQVATNAIFTTGLVNGTGTCSPTTCTYNGFTAPGAGTFYWRVRVKNNFDSYGLYSAVRSFIVRTTAPTVTAPLDNAVVTASKPTLSWPTFGLGAKYNLQIASDSGFGSLVVNLTNLNALFFIPTASLVQGDWYWHVQAVDLLGNLSPFSVTRKFTVNIEAMPLNNAVITLVGAAVNAPVTFSWAAVPGATGYTVFLSNNSDMTGATAFPAALPASLSVVVPTRPAAIYYWYVAPTGFLPPTAPVPPSIIRKFSISPPAPTAPVLVTPATGNTLATTNPTLTWNPTVTTAGTPFVYEVQVATNAIFTTGLVNGTGTCSPTTCTYNGFTAPGAGTFYWRVRVKNNFDSYGLYSAVRSFIVRTTAPTVTAPLDNAISTASKPTLSWPTFGVGAKYNLQIANDVGFSAPTNVNNLNALFFIPTTSLVQGDWYWHVQAVDSLGNLSPFSATRKFTVNIESMPLNNAVITLVGAAVNAPVTFSWAAVPGATGYTVFLSNNSNMSSPTAFPAALPTSVSVVVPARPAGIYYWYVVPTGFAPTAPPPPSIVRKFTISPTMPVGPILTAPATGSSSFTLPLLDWNAVTLPVTVPPQSVDHYEVQIATNAIFTLGLQTFDAGTATQYQTVGLVQGTYYWRVRAYNNYLVPGAFSLVRTFIIDTAATLTPTLTAPIDNSSSGVKTPTFVWTRPVGATRFEIRYSSNYPAIYNPGDPLTTTGTVAITSLSPTVLLTATSYIPPAPLIPGTYYWQVRAFDAAGNPSPWSNLKTFKIFSLPTDTPQPNRFGPSDTILLTWGPLSWVTGAAAPDGGYYEIQIDNNLIAVNALAPSPEYELRGSGDTVGTGVTYSTYVSGNNYGVVVPDSSTPGGLPNGTWRWHVRGYNPQTNTYGAWSTVGTFVVDK